MMEFRKSFFLPLLAAIILLAGAPVGADETVEIYRAYTASEWSDSASKDEFVFGDTIQYVIHFGVSGLDSGATYKIKWIVTAQFGDDDCRWSEKSVRKKKVKPGYYVMSMKGTIPRCGRCFTWWPVRYKVKLMKVSSDPPVVAKDKATSQIYLTPPQGCVQPTAAFSVSVDGDAVHCTDQSTGNIDDWLWEFGDEATSTNQNPTHNYASDGTYIVKLTVGGECGEHVMEIPVTVPEQVPLQADFSADPDFGEAPLTVQFTDQSKGDIVKWDWNFGDGTTSTDQNPTHVFSGPESYGVAKYDVTLTVSNDGGKEDTHSMPIVTYKLYE